MAESDITVVSGVSWLHDQLRERAQDRIDLLKEGLAEGVPLHEYQAMVGRYKEAKRQLTIVLPELFTEFYQAEKESDEELEELTDE